MAATNSIEKISLSKAIQLWENQKENAEKGIKLADQKEVRLIYNVIDIIDGSVNSLVNCEKLSLSSNLISKIPDINLQNLKILSLGRNKIKRITGLSFLAESLEQLWISYNEISSLDGIKDCIKLKVLYISNNMIADIKELNALEKHVNLNDVMFKGNPFTLADPSQYDKKPVEKQFYQIDVKEKIPSIEVIDGELYDVILRSYKKSVEGK